MSDLATETDYYIYRHLTMHRKTMVWSDWLPQYPSPFGFCEGCQNWVDFEVCHCGDLLSAHNGYDGCPGVPYGCDCLRSMGGDDERS